MPNNSGGTTLTSILASTRAQVFAFFALVLAVFIITLPMLVEEVYQNEIVAIQAPITGKITWYTTPGWKCQCYGTVFNFQKQYKLDFLKKIGSDGKTPTGGILIRFSDGGHATIYGSMQFQMPEDDKNLGNILAGYPSNEQVKENLLRTVLNKSIYLSGNLMTSKESYAEKRNDLIHYVTDQMQNGIYHTRQTTKWVKDEITGNSREITQAEILLDPNGAITRQEMSVLDKFHVQAFNFALEEMPYDEVIEKQIHQQQEITMDVQTSIANAKKQEQAALTAEAEGKANAAKAKWAQETIKATEVTKADQEKQVALTVADKEKQVAETSAKKDLAVADLARQTADQYKQKLILEGQGEAEKRKLILAADGALAQKLEAYKTVQSMWAQAFGAYRGSITPLYVGGGSGQGASTTGNALSQFMDFQNMKAAREMALDMNMTAPATK